VLGKVREWLAFGLGVLLLQASPFALAQDSTSDATAAPDVAAARPSQSQTDTAPPCPEDTRCVAIIDPFADMHTGPGRGFPKFYVAARGEQIEILKRRTDWFYVRTSRQIEGWVPRDQILNTLELSGEQIALNEPTRADFTSRRWEAGVFFGRFEGASLLGMYGGYGISDHLSAELTIATAPGNITNSYIGTVGLIHTFAPEWRISPYAGIGTGVINIRPRVTIVQPIDSTDQLGFVAVGARGYIARHIMLRGEYRGNVVFTSRNENEEIHEWKLGLAFFF
jgi:hypothetical protein